MKVLLVTSSFHPLTGGAESYAQLLAQGLAQAGHSVVVATDGSWLPDLPLRSREHGYEVLRLRAFGDEIGRRDKVVWRQLINAVPAELHGLLGDFTPDIVHANSHETLGWCAQIALSTGAALVASLHEQNPDLEPYGMGRCRLAYQVLPVGLFLAASEFYAGRARSFGVRQERLRLVYHGVDTSVVPLSDAAAMRARLRLSPREYVVLCPGRIYTRKAQLDLVRCLPQVVSAGIRPTVILAGRVSDFGYAERLRRLVAELGVESLVRVVEDLTTDEMPALHAAADLVVQPSLEEGLGLAVIEAMAQGRPVIVTDVVGLREVVTHGRDGIIVPPSDPRALAQAIIALAADAELAASYGAAARLTALDRFNAASMVRETLAGYETAMATRRGAPW